MKKRLKIREIIPKDSSGLLNPTILFGTLKDLDHLSKDQITYVTGKLNKYLQSQILSTIGSTSEKMAKTVQDIAAKLDYHVVKGSDLVSVVKDKVLAVIKKMNDTKLVKEAEEIEGRLVNMPSTKITDLLYLDIPLRENPIFDPDIRSVKITEYAKLAGLDEQTTKKLADMNILYFDDTDDAILSDLVKEGMFKEEQKQSLMLVSSLSKLTGDNLLFIKALKTQDLKSTANLVSWEKSDWQKLVENEQIPFPPTETSETYAENILFNIKRTYPSQLLVNRLVEKNDNTKNKVNLLDSLNTLLDNNDKLVDFHGSAVTDWRGIGAESRTRMQADLGEINRFANTYWSLGLTDIVNDKQLDLAAKKQAINSRLQILKKFFANNPELDLRYANLFDTKDGNISWVDIQPTDVPIIRKQVMVYQRILNIAKDPEDSITLLSKGYDSVMSMSEKSEQEFIQTSELPLGKARLTYAKAQRYSEVVAHNFEMIRDGLRGQFKDIRMANISTKMLANELQEIDGFADLFGSQNFCGCEECMSILSPVAYFVDLMRFIDTNVTTQVFAPPNDHHPLSLHERRQDLWELELTCDNTSTLIPYLTIVNEVLERYLEHILSVDDIYETFSGNEKISFYLPFNLPLEELKIYLGHFSTTLYKIYRLLKLPDPTLWRARLGLSKEEFSVITNSASPIDDVKYRYGNPTSFDNFPVQNFIQFSGISREQLDQLLSIRFNPDLANIKIGRQEPDAAADEILQNFQEILNQLSYERLDFIHRFIRLWKKTTWSVPEIDLSLYSLGAANIISKLDNDAVESIAQLVDIQEKLKLSVEEICALFYYLPVSKDYPKVVTKDGDKMLFERIFDLTKLFGVDQATNQIKPSASYYCYSFNTVHPDDRTIDPNTPLLLAGLSVSETELLLLFDFLTNEILFDSNGVCTLDRKNISLLYRHAKLAKVLNFSITDFIISLRLNFTSGNNPIFVNDLEQIFKLIEFQEWNKTTQLNISELYYILKGELTGAVKSKITQDKVVSLVLEIQKTTSEPSARKDALRTNLLTLFNQSTTQRDDILNWVSTNIDDPGITVALNTDFTNLSDLDLLTEFLRGIERTLLLFSKLGLKQATIHNITTKQQLLGIVDLKGLTLDNLKSLDTYNKQIALVNDDDNAESLILFVLQNFARNSNAFSATEVGILSTLWKKDKSLIDSLAKSLFFQTNPIEALEYLWTCLGIADLLGIDGFSLVSLGKDDVEDLVSAREIMLGAFSSKYSDEKTRNDILEPYSDTINVLKRDILCNYIIGRGQDLKFNHFDDIYSYFLLDVEMGSCFRTSRLVCAISSLQLYVHRCLVNLERSEGEVNVDPSKIPADEWEWRKYYQDWVLNRKVFLYPENYLEPDLRDDKTPIFEELEDELLQENITKESAETAYQKYLSQFAELARLKTNGSYYHYENGTWTYYFFARTQQDPPQYYYRKWINNKIWTPWEKIDLAIDSDHVSAIIYSGKLYLFWVTMVTSSKTNVSDISNITTTNTYSKYLVYSFLNERGTWITPQKLSLFDPLVTDKENLKLNKILFPITRDRIYVIGYDPIFSLNYYPGVSKLDLFRNMTVTYKDSMPGLILPNSNLLVLGSVLIINQNQTTVYLRISRNQNRFHEAEFEYELSSVNYIPSGIYVTGGFDIEDTSPELHLVGYRPGDFVFKLGNQEYLIQHKYIILQDPIDTSDPVFDKMALSISSKTAVTGIVNSRTNYINSTYPLIVPNLSKRYTYRLSTSLADDLGEILFNQGLEEFLSLTTQQKKEYPIGITFTIPSELRGPYDNPDHIDFKGAYGTYYQELFFHIPFLIANHLNANQKFEEAKWWYERIFNPTANDVTSGNKLDRTWQYIEFKNVTVQKMKDILTDEAAIVMYEKDPFNPYAIARLRSSAYQKAIVMKYIDNLIDWGDYLFAQDTMESINEATMLYVLASDILGKRPIKIGTCEIAMGTGDEEEGEQGGEIECKAPLTYEKIEACSIDTGTDFLIALENWQSTNMFAAAANIQMISIDRNTAVNASTDIHSGNSIPPNVSSVGSTVPNPADLMPRHEVIDYADVQMVQKYNNQIISEWESAANVVVKKLPAASTIVTPIMLAFCIPPNDDLLTYWDRVEDRLFKIRNCMNISGIRRQLALFQPPISLMDLLRAKAAGLSLEDILMPSVVLPPYRFSYLVEKAKQFTQTVQTFGSALLNALEKKDMEELTLLRSVHERSILDMTTEIKRQQITEAMDQRDAAQEAETNVQNRIDYYQGLIDGHLILTEIIQEQSKHAATVLQITSSFLEQNASIIYLIPEIGSPFALKFGGREVGDSTSSFADFVTKGAIIAEAISSSAGLEASFDRREQEWKNQLLLAQQELKQADKQKLAADIRVSIAENDFNLHEKTIEQANELDDFYKNKFTKLGLYDYLSVSLNGLYREAYIQAYNMAKMAELAYVFETDDQTPFIANDNWQLDNAGLLAGERLLLQLQRLETAYIQNNRRDYEVTQSFSLSLLDPEKLISLRQNGTCDFAIPEVMFDLLYPGQYKRLIKSVRLTVPCVVGPYTNVSAKLTLLESKVRKGATINEADLISVPEQRSTSIATSTAQGDSGTFEFSFRDERYLPFEGAGAISSWELELPSKIRWFDYDTISDVIMHISYTAKENGEFRKTVESQIVNILSKFAANTGLFRLISVRHDFPNSYHQLLNSPTGQPQSTEFNLEMKHFPYFISDKEITLSSVKVYLKPKPNKVIDVSGLTFKVNNVTIPAGEWSDFGQNGEKIKVSELSITGTPIMKWTIDSGIDGLKKEELDDVLVLSTYTAS